MERTIRLAVIDSDSGFVRVLTNRLETMRWEHRVLAAVPPFEELSAMRLDALLVDLSTLRVDRWRFLEQVSSALPGIGIVVCTEPSTVAQRVRGLGLGADDWITKPCHPQEVIARLDAVARRRRRVSIPTSAGPLVAGKLRIEANRFQVFVGDTSAKLTRREFELLHLLAEAEGRVLEREDIYQRVWGYAMARGDRSVDVFVRKLRQKLEQASPGWTYIHTHFGIGYRFEPEQSPGERAEESDRREVPNRSPSQVTPAPDASCALQGGGRRVPAQV